MPDDVANRLAKKLKLKQTPGKGVMKEFAKRVRALQGEGHSADQAALRAANDKFPAEFTPNHYDSQGESMETILSDIEEL
jgi:hypothetical protein